MRSLTELRTGEIGRVMRLQGTVEIRRHLEDLGLVPGGQIRVISENSGGCIIEVKGSRLAMNEAMAEGVFLEDASGDQ